MPYPLYYHLFSADRGPATIRVLRSRNAALVLGFLQESFKEATRRCWRASG